MKLSRAFTHECELRPRKKELFESLGSILHLEEKLGVLLLQFPPSQHFKLKEMERFFTIIRSLYDGHIALEPRHQSWGEKKALRLMKDFNASKVLADPEKCECPPVGKLLYHRLHGSPEIYRSSYAEKYLLSLARELCSHGGPVWCIFDNTTFGHATENALRLRELV